MALDGEIEKAELVTVELAHGQIQLHQDPTTGTLLSQQPVEPIYSPGSGAGGSGLQDDMVQVWLYC